MAILSLSFTQALGAAIVAAISLIIHVIISDVQIRRHLPGGPSPSILLGNTASLPKRKPFLQFHEWAHTHGPLYTIFCGRQPALIVSSFSTANALLALRAAKYSSRPRSVVFGEIYSQDSSIIVQQFGPSLTARRKLIANALANVDRFKDRQLHEASKLVYHLISDSATWVSSVDRFTASIVFMVAYGRRIDSVSAAVIQTRRKYTAFMGSLMIPGAYLAESFPLLKHVPEFFAPWKKEVREKGDQDALFKIGLIETVRRDVEAARGQGVGSSAESLLQWHSEGGPDTRFFPSKMFLASVPNTLFSAGSDTTASSLQTAIFAFVIHPHVLRIAQAEIDSLVGPSRSPTFEDLPNLPYISAIVTEVTRWRPVFPLGLFHATSSDDYYKNYFIPKGTTVIANTWAMNHDPEYYPSPQLFAPERHLSSSDPRFNHALTGSEIPGVRKLSSFGWGRRVCLGMNLAINSLQIVIAKMIWAFDISGFGMDDVDKYDLSHFTDGMMMKPEPFQCQFKLRSVVKVDAVEDEMGQAEAYLERYPAYE